jgi:hypothetical protein
MLRAVLWVGAAFNTFAAGALAFPDSIGSMLALPPVASTFHAWLLAFFVALFGATYAWMARQAAIPRPLVALAAIGKSGVFLIALACWWRGDLGTAALAPAIGDAMFAGLFFWWLRATD